MVVLTAIMAWSVVRQAKLAKDAEERQRVAQTPKLLIQFCDHAMFSGGVRESWLVGFSINNPSYIDVTVAGWLLELGVEKQGPANRFAHVKPLRKDNEGNVVSEPDTPRRLRYGDTMTVLFDPAHLNSRLQDEDASPLRWRARCEDSLGNVYRMDRWILLEDVSEHAFRFYDDPGLGYISPEERARRDERWWRRRPDYPQ